MAQTIFNKVISPVKGVIDKATSNDKTPTPGYLFNEINKLTYSSVEACQDVEDYLFVRLKKDEVNIKLKVLRVIKHTLLKGHKSFRLGLQRRTSSIQEYLSYRGPPDPVYGDSQNKSIRDEAQEIMTLLFTEGVGGGNETYGKGESAFSSSSSSSDTSHYSHSFVGGKVMQSDGNFFPSSSPSSVTERMFNSIKEIPKKIVNVVSKEEEGAMFDPHVHWSSKSFTLSNTSGLPPSSQVSVDIGYRNSKPGLPGGSWASSSSSPSTSLPSHQERNFNPHGDDEDDSDSDYSSDDDNNYINNFLTLNNINDQQGYHNNSNNDNNNNINNNSRNNFNLQQTNQSNNNKSQINNGVEGNRENRCHMSEEDKQYIYQTIDQLTGSGGGIRNDLTKSELSLFHQRVSNFDLHFVITIIYDKFESSVWQVRYRALCLFEFMFKSPSFFNSNLSLFTPYYNPSKLQLLQSSTQKSIRDKLRSLLSLLPSSSSSSNLPSNPPASSPVDNQTHVVISEISPPFNNQPINSSDVNNNNNNNNNILLIDLS